MSKRITEQEGLTEDSENLRKACGNCAEAIWEAFRLARLFEALEALAKFVLRENNVR